MKDPGDKKGEEDKTSVNPAGKAGESHSDPGDEQTVIRGQGSPAAPQQGNDDETVLRKDPPQTSPDGGDDETVLRQPAASRPSTPPPSGNDDETVLRKPAAQMPVDGADDETVLRASAPTQAPEPGADDATVLRSSGSAPDKDDEATILRGGSSQRSGRDGGSEEATILRGGGSSAPQSSEATILRDPGGVVSSDSATILRGPGEDKATILRGGSDDDATILRDGDDDDDRTIINDAYDDDSTIIGNGPEGQDTTYIASVGKQIRPKGNSEAGRLLKNRFVLEEKIGSGGMGDVYKALDLRQQEAQERDPYIAIKLLNENFARHKDAFLSLQRETSRTRGIPHPNIMAVYDFDREGDTVFMSMELLDGKPLDDYLKEHPEGVSVDDAWIIIDGICQGLSRAHNAGIVHSDFKPGNIFYTRDKTAKVFDFGIARAVSNPNELESDGEKTVFDAGSLGALTPTYASYEMLKGMEPSKSDDVYAVALVAYELFMGKHPYDRVPADKAYERGLKPKPVPFLKRRHWRALKKALELKGEDRTQTIDEFYEGIFSEDPPYFRYAAIATVLIASIGFGIYQTQNQKEVPDDLAELYDVMARSRLSIGDSLSKASSPTSPLWESDVWHDQLATDLTRWKAAEIQILDESSEVAAEWRRDFGYKKDPEIEKQTRRILEAYIGKINQLRTEARDYDTGKHENYGVEQAIEKLEFANDLMDRVKKHYQIVDPATVAQVDQQLDVRLAIRQDRLAEIEAQEAADDLARQLAEQRAEEARKQRIFEENRLNAYEGYLAELKDILKCKGDLPDADVRRFGELLDLMSSEWPDAYNHQYPTIVSYMSRCIGERIGLVNPERARTVKSMVVSYLPRETEISSLVIEDKDPCDERGLVGRGDRNRNWCSDEILGGGQGPDLVVIPPENIGEFKYAISRAEIRIGDYNLYCQNEGCEPLSGPSSLPATNISVDQAKAYTRWLSSQTGQKYRLPTVDEWEWAVLSEGRAEVDQNINCTVDSRGVRLGEKLLNAVSGRPNPWGLYNFVGNAREWAVTGDNSLLAMGGAHTDPRQECTLEKRVAHDGAADPVTGFRVLREIEDKSRKQDEPTDLAASD